MIIIKSFILILACSIVSGKTVESWSFVGNPLLHAHPCINTTDISLSYEPGLSPEEENQYQVFVDKDLPISTKIKFQFDSEAIVTLGDKSFARLSVDGDDNKFKLQFFKEHNGLSFAVKGVLPGVIPYLISFNINNHEYCKHPWTGFLDQYIEGYKDQAVSYKKKRDSSCGRRKVTHTELIVNGASTKPGDWPWHVALYRLDKSIVKYICGGTLISKSFVLTAAHCTTIRGIKVLPEIISVVLAKYNLIGGDVASQERAVHEIIVHDKFDVKTLDHDISLLKLKTMAVFDDYIQPACLWQNGIEENLPSGDIRGTVVGWGFDQTDALSTQLLQTTLPILPDVTCIRRNPVFYTKILTENKFCAGLSNGTSPCNGDSGGGFMVFVPDTAKTESRDVPGSWFVRGIVSTTKSRTDAPICDPEQNVVFTDVAKYKTWIDNCIKDDFKNV